MPARQNESTGKGRLESGPERRVFLRPAAVPGLSARARRWTFAFWILIVLFASRCSVALDPSLEMSQYAHNSWTIRDGFSVGNIFSMTQTTDGYIWLAGEYGIFRFDGVRATLWQRPGPHPKDRFVFRVLGTRDGALWIGTFDGLAKWDGKSLTRYPGLDGKVVGSLLEDHEGTVWAGSWPGSPGPASLCAIRNGSTKCYGDDGRFGKTVGALYEDSSRTLWAYAETGLWRMAPGNPTQISKSSFDPSGLSQLENGPIVAAHYGAGLVELDGKTLRPLPIHAGDGSKRFLAAREVDSNKLLRDRDGGLWIGTVDRGLIHLHHGRTDVFTKADGLSGNIILSLFEDREGNIWVSTVGGIDRFRELPVTSMLAKQGLPDDVLSSVVASAEGSAWIASQGGLTRWKDGQTTTFTEKNGLPNRRVQSLYEDGHGRIWAFTDGGLAYFDGRRFIAVKAQIPSNEVYSISGDSAGNLWLSGNKGLSHLLGTRMVEHFPWSTLGRAQQAKVAVADKGGVWLSYWNDGGVQYFRDGRVRASYTPAEGLGEGHVPGLRLGRDGAVWAATENGGLSYIKDGRVATLGTANGLPCNAIHWSLRDDERSLWMYTACGLVRVSATEMDAWIANPQHRVQTTLLDTADGVKVRSIAVSSFGPTAAKTTDGKLWFLAGEGLGVVDPRHLITNKLPPPVHIEKVMADEKTYWENLPGAAVPNLRLPARMHDLQIYYTGLSLVAPEKMHFKYKLEGQDDDWREVVNDRDVQYSNLSPGAYRFRVMASNNSGIWNEQGDSLQFMINPAYYQTNWFRTLCAIGILALIWALYQLRVRQLRHQFEMTLVARVSERTRIARELHDTLLQSFQAVLLRLQTVSQLMQDRPVEAQANLDSTIDEVADAITEGRDAVQGLRESVAFTNDLPQAVSTLGEELSVNATGHRPAFRVAVEGETRNLPPILRDEIYRISAEALRNSFQHAGARNVEVEIRYDSEQFRLRVRDDGKGIDPAVLERQGAQGHYGLHGMRERATLIGGTLTIWSEVDAGTEVELRVPGTVAYTAGRKGSWLSRAFAGKEEA